MEDTPAETIEPATEPTGPPSFDDADQLGVVELDRYCRSCGYNLRQQAVRREPVTGLLLCKCPECGSFEPANQAMTRPRSWFGNLVILIWLAWIAALGGAVAGAIGSMSGLAYEAGEMMSRTQSLDTPIPDPRADGDAESVRMISFQYQLRAFELEYALKLIAQSLAAFGIAFGLAWVFLVFVPHWPRKGYLWLTLAWPIIGLIAFLGVRLSDDYTLEYADSTLTLWIFASPLLLLMFAYGGGAFALMLGRPIARLIVRIAIPSRQRGPFAYLWLVDGKVPAQTK